MKHPLNKVVMSINIISFYEDCTLDDANKDINGNLNFDRFNRLLWRAQLKFIDWLTGHTKINVEPPPPLNQKNRDFLSPFITKSSAQVYNGTVLKPIDYYTWNDMYFLRKKQVAAEVCEEDVDEVEIEKVPIQILEPSIFNSRINTWIEDLKPENKPITKLVGRNFEFAPIDVGSITLEYIRYPRLATIVSMPDPDFNDEKPDPNNSIDIEFDEQARNHLIWFVTDLFSNNTLNGAMKQLNTLSRP